MDIETGQLIRLQIPVRTRALWLSPAWAVICGVIASGAFVWNGRDILIAALALVLADGAWATVWWGLVETNWPDLMAGWNTVHVERDAPTYALRGSPAHRSQHWLAHFHVWWQTIARPQAGTPVLSALFSTILAVLLSAVIGWQALTLSLGALALIQLGVIGRVRGRSTTLLQGSLDVGLAWLLGHAVFSPLSVLSALTALIFSFAYASVLDLARGQSSIRRWLLPQLIMVAVLILIQEPLTAMAFIAVLIAQGLLATVLHSVTFARAAQFWLMLAMLIAALGIR
jgi:hypothetical protein